MSQENVKALRSMYEELKRGNFAAAVSLLDPDAEWYWTSDQMGLVGKRSFRGIHEIRKGMAEWLGTWDSFWIDAEEIHDAGDRAVAFVCVHARLKGSTAEVETRQADVYTFRNGKIVRIDNYADRAEALKAVRLEE